MSGDRIEALERQIFELTAELQELRKANVGDEVPNYTFATLNGEASLLDLFGSQDRLLAIHNMGQGCRYCTLWADGLNSFLPHLESAMSVVLLSRDPPDTQRRFANSRAWQYRLASHGGGEYISEQTVLEGQTNMPGAVVYERSGSTIRRKNACIFGPGDLYCSIWNFLALAGLDESNWTPQYRYWQRPERLDDGGANVLD
ncbi:MAG: DUF899 domain-containing protein [Pseudomonadales bacterium]|nr:DUF899 domain-containing protein [Pseudomonadales bacterium]NIX08876.1 DUF899 domain-containing protein [Pseudomonadales bacterium]